MRVNYYCLFLRRSNANTHKASSIRLANGRHYPKNYFKLLFFV